MLSASFQSRLYRNISGMLRVVSNSKSLMSCLVESNRQCMCILLQNCLGVVYTVYIENIPIALETLVGNILCCIVPPPGGPPVRFSIGAGDRQALQPPRSLTLPVTHASVHLLFQELGK